MAEYESTYIEKNKSESNLPPSAVIVYDLLKEKGSLTAKDITNELENDEKKINCL